MVYYIEHTCMFDSVTGALVNLDENKITELDWLERCLFTKLAINAGACVLFSDLTKLWGKKYVSKNSVWRVVSCIRKKLNFIGINGKNIIKNIPKSGYILNVKVIRSKGATRNYEMKQFFYHLRLITTNFFNSVVFRMNPNWFNIK